VVRVNVVRQGPVQSLHSRIRCGTGRARLGADDRVLAVRLVPDGDDFNTLLQRLTARLQLGASLVGEAIADANRVFRQREHGEPPREWM
jgi:hypothetical protein